MRAVLSGLSTGDEKKTPGAVGEPLADLTQAYETLRERVLSRLGATAPGLTIFLQQGMAAWMEICSAVLPDLPVPVRNQTFLLPTEIVQVMAQMVWARFEEVHP